MTRERLIKRLMEYHETSYGDLRNATEELVGHVVALLWGKNLGEVMRYKKMAEWIAMHNVGVSSMTMWCAVMGARMNGNDDIPHDIADFSYCHNLCEYCKLTGADLQKVVSIYPYWKPFIDHWGELSRLYEQDDEVGFHKLIMSLRVESDKIRGVKYICFEQSLIDK